MSEQLPDCEHPIVMHWMDRTVAGLRVRRCHACDSLSMATANTALRRRIKTLEARVAKMDPEIDRLEAENAKLRINAEATYQLFREGDQRIGKLQDLLREVQYLGPGPFGGIRDLYCSTGGHEWLKRRDALLEGK